MEPKKAAWIAVQIALVVVVLALVVGQVLGQPMLLSFVTTDSMEPTIEPGEGFVAVPPELAGGVEQGDVVVFEAEEIEGGGLTTHRVVGETEEGYVTQGDANPFTDQDGGEPHVADPEIRAVAWQPGGSVVTIPLLGSAAMWIQSAIGSLQTELAQLFGTRALLGTQGLAYLLFGASVILYLIAGRFESDRRRERSRDRDTGTSAHKLMALLTLVVIAGVTAAMVVPAGAEEFGIVSAEFDSDSPDVIEQGTSETFNHSVQNTGIVSTVVILEPAGERVDTDPTRLEVDSRSVENTTVTISAPEETGHYRAFVQQYRYLGLLPTPVIEGLYEIHPWVPLVAINAVVAVPFYLGGLWLLGSGRLRDRSRKRSSWLS